MKASSKRKRTKDELEEVKDEELELKHDRHAFLQQVKRLKEENARLECLLAPSGVDSKMRAPTLSAGTSKSSQPSSLLQ